MRKGRGQSLIDEPVASRKERRRADHIGRTKPRLQTKRNGAMDVLGWLRTPESETGVLEEEAVLV